MAAGSLKRIGAYLIDILLILLVSSIITSIFPNKKMNELSYKYNEFLYESYNDINSDSFDQETFNKKLDDHTYEISKASTVSNLLLISIYVLYFIGFNRYNNGKTVGKSLLKIEIVDLNGEVPSTKQFFIRGLILYPIVFDFLRVILILLLSKSMFLSISSILAVIRFIIFLGCGISMVATSCGIHDRIAGTRVILLDSMKEEDNATKWKKNTEKEKKVKSYKNNHTSGKKRG